MKKFILIFILVVGLIVSSVYVPVGTCYNLGFRGTTTKNTDCRFEGYYLVHKRPRGSRGPNTQIRVHKPRIAMTYGILFAFIGFLAFVIPSKKK